ncbi:hypothetical protein [uncultured Aquimarina sp.]|uniref:hypothetical protein n=1 Tax=uncultured Aquimarina sp. TaxID=575652 RepID=UPI002620E360|nr:hypothetical protein [uncultured Aquimarina sp.]
MTHRTLIALLLVSFTVGCNKHKKESESLKIEMKTSENEPKSLLDNVRLAINPKFQDWVLFKNGTYIIFDDISKVNDIQNEAIKLMEEFGPVSAGGPAGDFNVTSLNQTKGWIVSSHGYGMYTYVHPNELNTTSPDNIAIGIYGRTKRDKDGNNPKIIYINKSN